MREDTLVEQENATPNTDTGASAPVERQGVTSERRPPVGRPAGRPSNQNRPTRRRYSYNRRRKVCQFCAEKVKEIDYKDVSLLRRYITSSGRIRARRKTGTCAKHQRMLAKAIKRARHIALLPYTAEHVRQVSS